MEDFSECKEEKPAEIIESEENDNDEINSERDLNNLVDGKVQENYALIAFLPYLRRYYEKDDSELTINTTEEEFVYMFNAFKTRLNLDLERLTELASQPLKTLLLKNNKLIKYGKSLMTLAEIDKIKILDTKWTEISSIDFFKGRIINDLSKTYLDETIRKINELTTKKDAPELVNIVMKSLKKVEYTIGFVKDIHLMKM